MKELMKDLIAMGLEEKDFSIEECFIDINFDDETEVSDKVFNYLKEKADKVYFDLYDDIEFFFKDFKVFFSRFKPLK